MKLIKSKQKLRYICIYRFFFVPLRPKSRLTPMGKFLQKGNRKTSEKVSEKMPEKASEKTTEKMLNKNTASVMPTKI